jgi:catecholate siderophore receptor
MAISVLVAIPNACADPPPSERATSPDQVEITGSRPLDLPQLTQPIAQTPQTIKVIPREIIELKGLSDVRDVLRLDPSVAPHADEDNAQGTNVQIRGFSARSDLYLDGQLDPGSYYRDPFFLEAVEVLKGPSSVIFGRGSTGGAVEQVSKRPQKSAFATGQASVGDDGLARLTVDINRPLSADVGFRLNAMAHKSDIAGRDFGGTSRAGIAPTLQIGMGEPTQVVVSYLHQAQWDRPDYGVPWIDIAADAKSRPAKVSWGNFYGFKTDFSDLTADIGTVTFEHSFDSNLSFHNQLRYAAYDRKFRATDPVINPLISASTPLSSVNVSRTMRGGSSHESFLEDQADLTNRSQVFGLANTLVVGASAGRQTASPIILRFSGVPAANLIAPDENQAFVGVASLRSVVHAKAETEAAFAADTLELGGGWQLQGSARYDRFAIDYRNDIPTTVTFKHVDERPSWRGAVLYQPEPALNLYAMYGTSFDPSASNLSLSASTADLAPERSHTAEAGAKWNPNSNLIVSGAVFDTRKVNAREVSPTDPTVTILAGTVRVRGLEAEAQGRITPNWIVFSGYTYLDAAIVSSPNRDVGQRPQNTPRHSFRLFTAYDVTPKLTVGGEADYTSSRVPSSFPDANGQRQEVPGYWSAALLARYRIADHVRVQLNVDNLFDEHFYDGLDDNHVNVGAGRSIHLTLALQR